MSLFLYTSALLILVITFIIFNNYKLKGNFRKHAKIHNHISSNMTPITAWFLTMLWKCLSSVFQVQQWFVSGKKTVKWVEGQWHKVLNKAVKRILIKQQPIISPQMLMSFINPMLLIIYHNADIRKWYTDNTSTKHDKTRQLWVVHNVFPCCVWHLHTCLVNLRRKKVSGLSVEKLRPKKKKKKI